MAQVANVHAAARDRLTLQPNLQKVRHPGGDPRLDAAWVAGLRFEVGGASH